MKLLTTAKQKTAVTLLAGYVAAIVFDPLITVGRLNVETWAGANGLDRLWNSAIVPPPWLQDAVSAVFGPWGFGFVCSATIFAFWEPATRLWRRMRGKSPPTNTLVGLHVAEPAIGTSRLADEHWFEIAFRVYNGTGRSLLIQSVSGDIEAAILDGSSIPEANKFKMPPPTLLRDRSDTLNIANHTEFLVIVQQHLSPSMAARVLEALDHDGLQFYFDDLIVEMADVDKRSDVARLPINMGAFLRRRDQPVAGRVTRMRLNAIVGGQGTASAA